MDLSIIIVNWNSRDYLRQCIDSILAGTIQVQYEIIVIDSGSFDGCKEMLRADFPHVRFIQSQLNVGFAEANNIAFRDSQGEYLLFLNPDTELRGPAIDIVYRQLQTLPDAGLVGCQLLNGDGTVQTSCIKAFPTLVNQFLDAEALQQRFPRARLWGMAPLFEASSEPSEVDTVSGAFIMMRRSVFEQIGMFTTDYFMYSEDVDLCFKTRKAKWKNYYIPSAVVVHFGGKSSVQNAVNAFSSIMMLESRWRFFLNTRSICYAWLYRAGMCAVSAVRIALIFLFWSFAIAGVNRAHWRAVAKKWIALFRWTVGLEAWVKHY